jgi:hypothetical protein
VSAAWKSSVNKIKLGMHHVAIPWYCYDPEDKKIAEFLRLLRDNPVPAKNSVAEHQRNKPRSVE